MLVLCLEYPVDLHDEVLQVERLRQQLRFGAVRPPWSATAAKPVMNMTADLGSIALAFSASSLPSISGITMSVRSKSNRSFEQRHRLGATTDGIDVIADALKRPLQILTHPRVVFGQQDSRHSSLCSVQINFARSE